jgi:hypothetical protein
MKSITLKTLIILTIILSSSYITKAQWAGSMDSTGVIYRLGNVGIGRPSPEKPLDIIGDIRATSGNGQFLVGYPSGSAKIRLWNTNAIESVGISSSGNSWLNGGNVGIGTTSPSRKLDVNGVILIDPSSGSANLMLRSGAERGYFTIRAEDGGNLNFLDRVPGDVSRMLINSLGNVGIGTMYPSTKLDVIGRGVFGSRLASRSGFGNTLSLINETEENTSLFLWQYGIGSAHIGFRDGDSNLYFVNSYTDGSIDNAASFVLSKDGSVGIGTTNTFGYKLAVNGTIGAKEVIVETTSGWSDFVFADNYQLKDLTEVETFINENKHLPDVPSETEVKENGIDLGKMDATLLQKIEELTLYMIAVNKRMNTLETENSQLKNRINELEGK